MGVGIAGILMTQMLHSPLEYVSGATVQLEMTLCEALAFQWERKLMSWQTAFINSRVLSLCFQYSYTLARYLFVQQFFLHQLCGKLNDKEIHSFDNGFSTCFTFSKKAVWYLIWFLYLEPVQNAAKNFGWEECVLLYLCLHFLWWWNVLSGTCGISFLRCFFS